MAKIVNAYLDIAEFEKVSCKTGPIVPEWFCPFAVGDGERREGVMIMV